MTGPNTDRVSIVAAYPPLVATTASFGAGTLILFPIGAAEFWLRGTPHITVAGLLAVLYLGLGASALAFYLWNRGLHFLPASIAAPFANLIPVVGLLLAILDCPSSPVPPACTDHRICFQFSVLSSLHKVTGWCPSGMTR